MPYFNSPKQFFFLWWSRLPSILFIERMLIAALWWIQFSEGFVRRIQTIFKPVIRLFELLKKLPHLCRNFLLIHIKISVTRIFELYDKRLEWKTGDFYVEKNNVRQLDSSFFWLRISLESVWQYGGRRGAVSEILHTTAHKSLVTVLVVQSTGRKNVNLRVAEHEWTFFYSLFLGRRKEGE